MACTHCNNSSYSCRDQRSYQVTRGQRLSIWGHQRSKSKFPKNSQDLHVRSPEVRKQSFSRSPKIVILGHRRSESKISKEFPRSLFEVTRGQKVNYLKNAQDHQLGVTRGQKANFPKNPTTGKESLSLWAFWFFCILFKTWFQVICV